MVRHWILWNIMCWLVCDRAANMGSIIRSETLSIDTLNWID